MGFTNPGDLYADAWGADDTIIFAPTSTSPLWQVSAAGGAPKAITTFDSKRGEGAHRWPTLLPGRNAVLSSAGPADSGWDETEIVAQSLETGDRRVLLRGGAYARYVPTGHLVHARAGTLFAVRFDASRLEVAGDPVPVVEGILQSETNLAVQYSFSDIGSLVYVPGSVGEAQHKLVWVDRHGTSRPLPAPLRPYTQPRLSPDGRQVAVQLEGAKNDVWIYEIDRGTLTRFTFEGNNMHPAWTPDGTKIAFHSQRTNGGGLFLKPVDGSGPEEQLTTEDGTPQSWTPDGKVLAFHQVTPSTRRDLWLVPVDGDRKPRLFLGTPHSERVAMFFPDGKWVAYLSDESRREEIYVQTFPGPGGRWQITTDGGSEPIWARNGRELFYRRGNTLMAVAVTTHPAFAADTAKPLFEGSFVTNSGRANYDVSADGQRFLMIEAAGSPVRSTQLNVVLEWFEELKRRVPAR